MSKQSNAALIGGFVIGGVALMAIAAALLGGAEYFKERLEYVAYFDEQTKGLRVGSNVLLNGVRVGYVSDIALLVDNASYDTLTQVTLEILPEDLVITHLGEVVQTEVKIERLSHDNIVEQAGLRAQLETESFVTGQLVVSLKMRPETPATYRGINPPHKEIPTIPSNVQAILAKFREFAEKLGEDFDLEEIANQFNNIMVGIEELSNSQDLRDTLAGMNRLLNDEEAQRLATTINATLEELRGATAEARTLISNTDGRIDTIAGNIRPALDDLVNVLARAEETLAAATELLRGETVQTYQLQATLEEAERATRALREFFDYLERNPEALLSGKK